MAYTDKTYFLTKIKESDLDNLLKDDSGTPQDDFLTEAVKSADSLINGYLKKAVKTLPIPAEKLPDIIKQYSYDIAIYNLHDRIQFDDIPSRIKDKYDAAVNYLKDIASGEADLDIQDAEEGDITSQVAYFVDENRMSRDSF